jgi:hypothetical protein
MCVPIAIGFELMISSTLISRSNGRLTALEFCHRTGHRRHAFMNLTEGFPRCYTGGQTKEPKEGTMYMRKAILGAASALALASPAAAADLPVTPYSNVPSYERREIHTYEYRTAPPVVVAEPAPVTSETVIVRRPVIVAPPRVVIEEYPVYAAPPVYAYAGPVWRHGWGHRHHFHGGW